MAFTFSKRSLINFKGVHPDLVRVSTTTLHITPVDFGIIEGLRSLERQTELFNSVPKKSWTMNSRHLHGLAVDFMAYVGGVATWEEKYYLQIAASFKRAAMMENVHIIWGGDWHAPQTDSDHIELDRHFYPDEALTS